MEVLWFAEQYSPRPIECGLFTDEKAVAIVLRNVLGVTTPQDDRDEIKRVIMIVPPLVALLYVMHPYRNSKQLQAKRYRTAEKVYETAPVRCFIHGLLHVRH
jgi:hypothetical protein